jgi:hypothetical protein
MTQPSTAPAMNWIAAITTPLATGIPVPTQTVPIITKGTYSMPPNSYNGKITSRPSCIAPSKKQVKKSQSITQQTDQVSMGESRQIQGELSLGTTLGASESSRSTSITKIQTNDGNLKMHLKEIGLNKYARYVILDDIHYVSAIDLVMAICNKNCNDAGFLVQSVFLKSRHFFKKRSSVIFTEHFFYLNRCFLKKRSSDILSEHFFYLNQCFLKKRSSDILTELFFLRNH